jgi:hypothetical protein
VLSFASIGVYVWPIYWYPLHPGLVTGFNIAEYSIWAVFISDYVVQLSLATDKRQFLRKDWLTLLLVAFGAFHLAGVDSPDSR